MVKNALKRTTALILMFCLCLAIVIPTNKLDLNAEQSKGVIVSIAFPREADITSKGTTTWGHKRLVYANGNVHEANQYTNMQFVDVDSNSPICYCIEPGRAINPDNGQYVNRGERYFKEIENNRLLTSDEINQALGRIFQYGYIDIVSDSWVSQDSEDADKMAHAMATQFLVWEVVVGERDADFNHVDAPSGYNNVLEGLNTNHPLRTQVIYYYNKIVNAIKNHVNYPSFMTRDVLEATTVELVWNGIEYSATLVDTNNVLSNFTFNADNNAVNLKVNGNKLIISSKSHVNDVSITATKNGNIVRSGIVVWGNPATDDQSVASTYKAKVTDPIQAYINITVNTGMIYGYKTTKDLAGTQIGLSGAKIGLFPAGTTNFSESNAIATCISGQTIPGTTSYHPGGYYFTNIPYGTYMVKEIASPNGYILSDETRNITLNSDRAMVSVSIINAKKQGMIYGYKTTKDLAGTQIGLSGAKIGLFPAGTTNFAERNAIATCISGQTIPGTTAYHPGGYYFTNIPYGTYIVREIASPNGYILSNETRNVTLNSDRAMVSVSIVNVKKQGMIYGYKSTKDSGGTQIGLSGAKIGLFPAGTTNFAERNAIATCISGQTIPGTTAYHPGGYCFTNIPYGTYIVKEIASPNGYILSSETRNVTLNSDRAMVSVSIINYEKPCSIKGYKVDENETALRGATFGLFASTETEFTRGTAIDYCKTDANGVFFFDNVKTGKYIVTEITPLLGYTLNDKKFEVDLTVGGTEYVIAEKIVNQKFYGKIYGYKLNAQNDFPLADAKIGLFNNDSNFSESNAIKIVTTGSDGYFEFNNLEGGKTYWVKELEAPSGFLLSDAVFKRNIDSEEPIKYILYNDDFYVSIQGHKIDKNEAGLSGAEIGIFIKESDDLSYYVKKNALHLSTTGDDGYYKFNNLARGTYIIKELAPPPGYELNNIRYEVIVADKNDITVNTISEDGSIVDSRRYTTPAKIASMDIKIENEPVTVTGTKVDLNKEPLTGAIIGLFNSTETEFTESTALQACKTLSDGTFTFTHIPAGRYYIKEISAPAGFEVSEIKYTLIVTAVGSYQIRDENNVRLTNVEIINLPSPHKIDVTKLNPEGNTLSGAIFLLEWSEDGVTYFPVSYTETYSAQKGFTTTNVIDGKITVPESGNISFGGLCPNLYYRVTETKAPDGYNLLKEAAFEGFVSTNDNILVKLDVINTPTFVLPPTGGYGKYIVPVSVILSVGIASLAIYLIKKNIERKNKNEKI